MNRSRWVVGALLAALIVLLAGLSFFADRGSSDPADRARSGRHDWPEVPSGPKSPGGEARQNLPVDAARDRGTDAPGAHDLTAGTIVDEEPPRPPPVGTADPMGNRPEGGDERVPEADFGLRFELSAFPDGDIQGREAAIALTPDGKVLAIGRCHYLRIEPAIRLFSMETGETLGSTGQERFRPLLHLAFDAEGKTLRLLSGGGLFEYEAPDLGLAEKVLTPMAGGLAINPGEFDRYSSHASGFTLLQISTFHRGDEPDDGRVAVLLPRRSDPRQDWRILVLMVRNYHRPALLVSSPDGSPVALLETPQDAGPEPSPYKDRLRVFKMPGGSLVWEKEMPAVVYRHRYYEPDGSLAISPDGTTIAFGRDDGSVLLLDLRTGVETGRLEPPATFRERVDVVTWSHHGSWILTGHQGGTLLFREAAGRRLVRTLAVLDPKKAGDDQRRRPGFMDVLVNRELTLVVTLTHDGIVRAFGEGVPPRGSPAGGK